MVPSTLAVDLFFSSLFRVEVPEELETPTVSPCLPPIYPSAFTHWLPRCGSMEIALLKGTGESLDLPSAAVVLVFLSLPHFICPSLKILPTPIFQHLHLQFRGPLNFTPIQNPA